MTGSGAMNTRKRSRRRLIPVIVLVVCAAGIAGYAFYRGPLIRRGTTTSQELYQLVPVEQNPITLKVTASGTLKPGSTYEVRAKLGGTVTEVLVRPGDVVGKGQVLVRLDETDALERLQEARDNLVVAEAKLAEAHTQAKLAPTQSRLQVEQARTNLLNAEAKLTQLKAGAKPQDIEQARVQVSQAQLTVDNAKKEYERNTSLFEKGAVTRQQLDSAESKYLTAVESLKAAEQKLDLLLAGADPQELAAAEAAVAQARTNLHMAEENVDSSDAQQQVLTAQAQVAQARNAVKAAERYLNDTRIMSPIQGTVIDILAQPGELVGQSSVLLVIADLEHLEVVANVDETDVHSVKVGQPADIKVESVPGRVFKGVVESVAEQGKTISSVVYFEVTLRVDDDSGIVKAGMTADVDVVTDRRTNVLTIPNAALEERRGRLMARILDENGEPFFKRVELGISDGTVTEVISGLEAGEMVAVRRSGGTPAGAGGTGGGSTNPMPLMPGGGLFTGRR